MSETTTTPAGLSDAKRALLSRRLRAGRGTASRPAVPRRPDGTVPPLSFAQERLWFMEQFAPGTGAYNIPVARRLRGELDREALAHALDTVVARHETLRSRYPATDDGRPVLEIAEPAPVPLPLTEAADEEHAARLVDEAGALPFDLAAGPLLRALLVRLGDREHILLLVVHHSVSDGWSSEILISEILRCYTARLEGDDDPLGELPVRYGDFAQWQRDRLTGDALAAEVAYWAGELAGVEPLVLPTARPRPARQTFDGAGYGFQVDRELLDRLAALGKTHGATLHMVLLAAFQELLARYSGQREFAVGSPVAGRPEPELEGLIGMFVNVLPLRARLDGDPTFATLLERTRETCLEAYAHQELPFAQLVTELNVPRDVSRSPVFQAVLAVQNYATGRQTSAGPGPAVENYGLRASGTRFDVELFLMEWPDGLRGAFNYNTDLFGEADIARLAAHLDRLLHAVADRPDIPLSALDLLSDDERALETVQFNRTDRPVPADATLVSLIGEQIARTPDAVAVTADDRSLSYAELDAAADRIAARLRAAGTGPGDVVAVGAERSPELVAALLAVQRTGACYTPLDTEYPADRLAFMLDDSGARVLLTQRAVPVPEGCRAIVLYLDDADPLDGSAPNAAPDTPGPTPDDPAYLIYTSGSTGRPKGVPNTHRAVVNRLLWMQRSYPIGPDDSVLQKTPAGFDVSVWEFFWPLITGARLVLARPGGQKDTAYLSELIRSAPVTVAHFVPSMLPLFLAEEGAGHCTDLRRVVCSGEALPPDTARAFHEVLPGCALANLYGPTEAAIDVCAWECEERPDVVPIGFPVDNLRLYVLDRALRPVPPGAPGEIHIAGTGVALGYHRRPGLTARQFVPDPYGPPGSRLYRTGDLGRRRPDGALEHLGRIDQQVKLRGLRIEPGEIEAALRALPPITEAAVVVREDSPGDKRLAAYLVTGDGQPAPDPQDLRTALKQVLPDYMVPVSFTALPALPLTANGKLDRRALPAPQIHRTGGAASAAQTPAEHVLAAIWSEVLGLDEVGADEDFFDLGGHSLLATQVVARARRLLPEAGAQPVSVMDLFTCRTVRDLAALADLPEDARGPRRLLHRLTPQAPAGRLRATLVCVPYGGGSAVVYQPVADLLPEGYELWSVAIPGHDVGVTEEHLPFGELAENLAAEIRERVHGPLIVYGHCGVGTALAVATARLLEASGRTLEAVYAGAQFPFAKPRGRVLGALSKVASLEALLGNRVYVNWLTGMGVDTSQLDREQTAFIVGNMRRDSQAAEEYFTGAIADVEAGAPRLRAPLVSLVGDRDPAADFYQERYREWLLLAERSAVAVIDQGGHFFVKYRAAEVAEAVTSVHEAIGRGDTATLPARSPDAAWWFHAETGPPDRAPEALDRTPETPDRTPETPGRRPEPPDRTGKARETAPAPGAARFVAVVLGQLGSIVGSALTEFALPIWILLETGSLTRFALYSVVAMLPGIVVGPLAGAVVDRFDRRKVMLAGDIAAGLSQVAMLCLLLGGALDTWYLYLLLGGLSVALTFQRLAYNSAIPQLVPKRYLGHANGVVQLAFGAAQFVVPLVAVALMAGIGLRGILILDIASYVVAVAVLVCVRFPRTLPWTRREPVVEEIKQGFAYTWRHRGFRSMLLWFAALNLFLSPLFLLVTPLVLSFDTLDGAAAVATAGGAGAVTGGILMGVWGGPRRHRVRGMLALAGVFALAGAVTGLRADLWVIGAGAFGMSCCIGLVNGVYSTIVQVKVPQRFHGRVFALNTMVAWSTLPIGHGLVAPLGARLFDPLMTDDGALAGTVGRVLGTGPGRGIGLMYLLCCVAMLALVALALRLPALARFDLDVPDAEPDDLIGLRERAAALAASASDSALAASASRAEAVPAGADR
ncbi:non-ribosomal peptide synthetase/MFS transporter [Streptomyces sp. NBC_00525]|uniref:non-ribosomal peptide synthetase/MFS transporter n=1 Tax=Streptomyces sp. NBC_00525 TaxID=2903660 RepID=UPI002E80396F|nr:amino acid adenylation domain-containing protein [Streptomyces sp. NBC_00525]WUC97461.1 amino acid adenylation domain-containing protein [Streptomyces sp. NBC_00525]